MHAQQHVVITVGLTALGLYHLVAWAWPITQLPNITLPKLPLPWVVAIVFIGITFMVVEGGQRLRQKEFGQDHNLHLEGIRRGVTTHNVPKVSLVFTNKLKHDSAVGTASVRATLRWKDGNQIRDVPPLKWVGSEESAIDIGVGESAELLIALKRVNDSWDFAVSGPLAGTDLIWIYEQPFEFEIALLNVRNGRRLTIDESLSFRWEWRDDSTRHSSRPHLVSINPPKWTKN